MSKINNTIDKLRKEYRPTMDLEVLHSWAKDVVAALDVRPHIYASGVYAVLVNAYELERFKNADFLPELARIIADHWRYSPPIPTRNEVDIQCFTAEMKTSAGSDYYVTVRCGDRELTPHMFKIKGRADYEVAEWLWLFNGGEKPDIMAYDCDDPLKEDTSLNFEVGETPEEELKRLMQSRIAEGVVLRVSNPSSDDNWPSNMFKNAARYGKNGGEVK